MPDDGLLGTELGALAAIDANTRWVVLDLGEAAGSNARNKIATPAVMTAYFATAAQGALADSSLQSGDIGVNVQGYDAGLADIAGLAVTDGNFIVGDGANWIAESGATVRASLGLTIGTNVQAQLPVADEQAIVYKTGTPANTLTLDVNAFTAARTWTFPDAASTFAGLSVAGQTFTVGQKINVNSTTALLVEQDGVNDNTLVVDTTNGWVGIGAAPGFIFDIQNTVGTSRVYVNGDAAGFPRIYIGGSSSSVAAVFNRISSAADIYFGEDADTAGVVFRGFNSAQWGTFSASANKASSYAGAVVKNSATNSTSNTVRLCLAPHSGYNITNSPYVGGYNAGNNGGLIWATFNGSQAIRMRLDPDGKLGIGATPTAQLHADQSSATGAVPVLTLDQADIDYVLMKIIGTSDAGSADRTLVDAGDFTTPGALAGWIQIEIQDDRVGGISAGDYYIPFYAVPTA